MRELDLDRPAGECHHRTEATEALVEPVQGNLRLAGCEQNIGPLEVVRRNPNGCGLDGARVVSRRVARPAELSQRAGERQIRLGMVRDLGE